MWKIAVGLSENIDNSNGGVNFTLIWQKCEKIKVILSKNVKIEVELSEYSKKNQSARVKIWTKSVGVKWKFEENNSGWAKWK